MSRHILGYVKPHIRFRRGRWEYIMARNRELPLMRYPSTLHADLFCQRMNGDRPGLPFWNHPEDLTGVK